MTDIVRISTSNSNNKGSSKYKKGDIITYKTLKGRSPFNSNFEVIFPYKRKSKQKSPYGWNKKNGFWIVLGHFNKEKDFICEGYCTIPPREDDKIQLNYYTVEEQETPYKTLVGHLIYEKLEYSNYFKSYCNNILRFKSSEEISLDCASL